MSENLCIICQSHDNCFYESTFKLWCPRFQKKPPTNADRIRAMSDEELSYFLYKIFLNVFIGTPIRGELPKAWLDWLKQEVDE